MEHKSVAIEKEPGTRTILLEKGMKPSHNDFPNLSERFLYFLQDLFPSKRAKLFHDRALKELGRSMELDPSCSTTLIYLLEVMFS
jgi:hypothetical protein